MNKRQFHAQQWLLKEPSSTMDSSAKTSELHTQSFYPSPTPQKRKRQNYCPVNVNLPAFAPPQRVQEHSELSKHFIPGWRGESLISKDVKEFNQLLHIFITNAKESFFSQRYFNRKLKELIYNEFLSFAEHKAFIPSKVEDSQAFWNEVFSPNSENEDIIAEFVDVYCFRVAVIYLLKIRFISILVNEARSDFDDKKLLYPNSFLTNLFPKGSRLELSSAALEQNIYSWYRPSDEAHSSIRRLKSTLLKLSITELIKSISQKSESLSQSQTKFSHALSHQNFGLFLNSLLINFPLWLSTQGQRALIRNHNSFSQGMEIISCKYDGDFFESLALSHWLAQTANKQLKWEQILCPDFKRAGFEAGLFSQLFNELQFLTFLAQVAKDQNSNPVEFVSQIANGHLKNRRSFSGAQKNLLEQNFNSSHSTYNRIILNLYDYPKNNAQHYLITKISEQLPSLKDDGFLYVFSSKKLFVPSQKSKVEGLLKQIKIEGIFNLEDVKGKGEIPSYLYIFSKRSFHLPRQSRQTCFTFRFTAQLQTFQYCEQLTKLTQDFFIDNLGDVPALYHKAYRNSRFEFFQDAIVDGRLIHSTTKDSSKITHPKFFNNLLKSCMPLDFFFDVQNIDLQKEHKNEDPIFEYQNVYAHDTAPFVIIVDQRSKNQIKLEIIAASSLDEKAYQYGHASCYYFGLYPKWPKMNIDSIRDFLESAVGAQIIDLTFAGEQKKVKSNLLKVLLPKFFYSSDHLEKHIEDGLSFLKFDHQKLLELTPSQIKQSFNETSLVINQVAKGNPSSVMALLSHFKRSVEKCIDMFEVSSKNLVLNFNNPIIKVPLVLTPTFPIYPHNEDIFIEFDNTNSLNSIHLPLSHVKRGVKEHQGIQSKYLELHTGEGRVLTLYSDEEMLLFLNFLFDSLHGIATSELLQGISVPGLNDLKSIISNFHSLKHQLIELQRELPKIFDQLINQSITHS